MRACPTNRPRDAAVLEHERRTGRVERLDRGLHDRAERLLEVERLGDGLRDARERLELVHPPLRLLVQLGVLDRPRNLGGNRHEQPDLGIGEGTRRAGAHVEGALERLAGEDGNGEDRLVLVLAQVRKPLEPRVEVRLGRDHHRFALGCRHAGDALAGPHARDVRRVVDDRAVRRAQHELVGALVVEVHEASVGLERGCDLVRDRLHHLLQVERRVDDLDRLRQEREMTGAVVHQSR